MANISTVNLDAGTDSPRLARPQILEAVQRVNVMPSPVFGDGATDTSAQILAANALGRPLVFVGVSVVGTATTITVPIVDTLSQIFTPGSLVTIDNGLPVRPEWWGAGQNTVHLAVNALPAGGGVVQLECKTYLPNNHFYGFSGVGSGKYISKSNVLIHGRKMPRLADDCKSLIGGSVIQGMCLVYADNFEIRDCGVDCGFTVVGAYMGGVAAPGYADALVLTYPDTATKAASPLRKNARLHNVIGLASAPDALAHAVIVAEGYSGVTCTGEVIGCYGVHGVVFKAANIRAQSITSYCNDYNGVIIKSDAQATSVCYDIQIDSILVDAAGPAGWAPYAVASSGYGLLLQADSNNISRITIGKLQAFGYVDALGTSFGGAYSIDDVQIGLFESDHFGVSGIPIGVNISAAAGQAITRCHISSACVRNCYNAAVFVFDQSSAFGNHHFSFGRLECVNASDVAINCAGESRVSIGEVAVSNAAAGVYRIAGTSQMTVGQLWADAGATTYAMTGGGLAPALQNSWAQVSSNDPFGVDLTGGRVAFRGLIRPGSSNQFCALPRWAWPATNKRFLAQGYNGTTQVAVPVMVSSAGVCNINEIGGGTANVGGGSGWLSLSGITWDLQA